MVALSRRRGAPKPRRKEGDMRVTDIRCPKCGQAAMVVDGRFTTHWVNAVVCVGSRVAVETAAVARVPERAV